MLQLCRRRAARPFILAASGLRHAQCTRLGGQLPVRHTWSTTTAWLPGFSRLATRPNPESEDQQAKHASCKEPSGSKPPNQKSNARPPPSPQNNNNNQGPNGFFFSFDLIQVGAVVLLVYVLSRIVSAGSGKEITWQEFQRDYLERGLVRRLEVVNKHLVRVITTKAHSDASSADDLLVYFTIGSVEAFERQLDHVQKELVISTEKRVPVYYLEEGKYKAYIWSIAPTALFLGFLVWLSSNQLGGATKGGFRGAGKSGPGSSGGSAGGLGGIFGMGQSRAKLFNKINDVNVRFKDVAGMDEAKEEVMEFVSFLKDPQKYERLGAKIPRGAILSGPPGTGKTLIAKATAGEAGVPFFSVSGSEFIEMFAGIGASRVRDLFRAAREKAPCIVFIDEIDAIGKSRSKTSMGGGHDEREATLNQLLVEMDGFKSREHVVVLAGTNRPDVLDSALLRPGRFDRHISIDRPDLDGRIQIFNVHLARIRFDKHEKELAGKLAAMTPGFSGADIANCCNEAALIAARREDAEKVELIHFEQAIERVIAGLEKKSRVLAPDKRKVVAYHEAGHAVSGWFLKYADPLVKVSIIPRGSAALGYAQYLPGDQYLVSEQEFRDKMAMTLGGRVSEELHFPSVTLGGADDFKKCLQMALAMVTRFGMSPELKHVYYDRESGSPFVKPFSEATGTLIDSEVRRIVSEAHSVCRDLLVRKAEAVKAVAEELLSKEVLTRQDMIRLLGPRPFPERSDAFDKFLAT